MVTKEETPLKDVSFVGVSSHDILKFILVFGGEELNGHTHANLLL